MVSKRGVGLEATYFHAPPYTSERAKQKVVDLAKIVARYSGPIKLHVVNFSDIQLYIYDKCPHDELSIPPDNRSIAFPLVPTGIPPAPGIISE